MSKFFPGLLLAGCLASGCVAYAQSDVQTQAIVTVMPKKGKDAPPDVTQAQVQAAVNNKRTQVSSWVPLRGEQAGLQIMILVDDGARSALSLQIADLKDFIQHLPAGAQVGVAYMQNGQANIVQNITADRKLAMDAFRLPMGIRGINGSPYFSLSSLVKNWPSGNTSDRREVLMITDGVDLYYGRAYDPNDPYVQTAISDAQKAGIPVYSIFWKDTGRFDSSQWTTAGAQNYLLQVSQGTGGRAYWQGFGNPVSFVPFLDDLHTRLQNQYELGILASARGKTQLQSLKVKTTVAGVNVDAPQMVLVPGSEGGR